MEIQQRDCQNCKAQFEVTEDDLDFYAKLKVPSPTFCPECRMQRRIMWRCERSLYKRDCDLCGRGIISVYSKDKPYKVYCRECFHGDKWNPLDYGQDYDFSRPFFEQFRELQRKVPRQFAFAFQNVNSDYTNGSAFNKNCYLIFVSDHNEDSQYSYSIFYCRNSADLLNSTECELCYECITCRKCYQVSYSEDCSNSQNLAFCRNCVNCQNCVGSVDLKNQQYCILNEQYTKEEYEKKVAEMRLDTREGLEKMRVEAQAFWQKYPVKYIHGQQNVNVVGDYIFNSKSSYRCFDSDMLEDCKYMNHGNSSKFVYDAYVCVDSSEYSLEIIGALGAKNCNFSMWPFSSFECDYIDTCENSGNLFGCVSLHKQQYCILNKQYAKEDYEALRAKILKHMDEMPYVDGKGRTYKYGEFIPTDLCEFGYNETVVQEYFPLTKEEALAAGYKWKDPEEKSYAVTLKPEDIPATITEVKDDVLKETIGCAHQGTCNHGCTTAFRVTPAELQLYQRLGAPLPLLCFNCRHFARLARKNPIELHHRACQCAGSTSSLQAGTSGGGSYNNVASHPHGDGKCPNEFETTYAPDSPRSSSGGAGRKEIVYCEACYQQEVV